MASLVLSPAAGETTTTTEPDGGDACVFDVCHLHPEREVVSASRAEELVACLWGPAGSGDTSSSSSSSTKKKKAVEEITHVKLSNKSYTKEAADIVAARLKTLESVTSVDVSDVIAGRPEAEALQSLAALSSGIAPGARAKLRRVSISDNALGQKGIDALLPLLTSRELVSLHVCNNGMSADAARQLARVVLGASDDENDGEGEASLTEDTTTAKTTTKLETFHYFNNMSGDGGAEAVAEIARRSPNLVDLRFSGTRAGRAGSLAVAQALMPLQNLVTLDLVDNLLAGPGGDALGSFLTNAKPPLERLDLRDCALGDDGWASVAAALAAGACDTTLEALDVSGNDLTPDAADCVPGVLGKAKRLKCFALEENELATKGCAKMAAALIAARPLAHLERLALSSNDVGNARVSLALARAALVACPSLRRLDLDGNALPDAACDQLADLLGDKLGPLDDNDPDAGDEDEEDDEDDLDDLVNATAHLDLKPPPQNNDAD